MILAGLAEVPYSSRRLWHQLGRSGEWVIPLSCVVCLGSARGSGANTTGRKEVNPSGPDYNAKFFNIRGDIGQLVVCVEREAVQRQRRALFLQHFCIATERVLLGRDDVNPNKLDDGGRALLWWAALNGHVRATGDSSIAQSSP